MPISNWRGRRITQSEAESKGKKVVFNSANKYFQAKCHCFKKDGVLFNEKEINEF